MDSSEVANRLVRKYRNAGDRLVEQTFAQGLSFEGDQLLQTLKMHMWNELYLGVLPPARELELLQRQGAFEDNLDLFLMLSDQIRDEVKHSKLFSRRLEELGGNPNILDFEPTPEQERMLELMVDHDNIVGPAATLQISSEPMLARIMSGIIENDVVDRRSQEVFRQSELDEGNHINTGKKIIERFATEEADQRFAERLGDEFATVLFDIYGLEYEPTESVVLEESPASD